MSKKDPATIEVAKHLLKLCYPYIESHYERSQVGFGVAAKHLMTLIEDFMEDNP